MHASSFCVLEPLVPGDEVVFACDLTIGRDERNDLVLPSRRVSAQHARIEWRGGRWYLRDLGSTNGSTVNGRWADGLRVLTEGDTLTFAGEHSFRVACLGDPLPSGETGGAGTEEGVGDQGGEILGIELAPIPPEAGAIRVLTSSGVREFRAELPFHLLRLLAAHPGEWMKDDELRAALWGRGWEAMHRNTYLEQVRVLRRLLSRKVIGKERGRTRLEVAAGVVRIQDAV